MTPTVPLADSMRILLRFSDSTEIGAIIKKAIDELERAAELERHAVNLAYAIQRDRTVTEYSLSAAAEVMKIAAGDG